MRKCFKCSQEKEDIEFTKGCTYCRSCESIRWKERYALKKETYAKRKKTIYDKKFAHACNECGIKFIGRGIFCSVICKLYNGIDKKNGCWIWKKDLYPNGYGQGCFNGKNQYVHRISFQIFKGTIDKGKYVCHKCDIKSCINPEHLFLGSAKDNMQDAKVKGRLRNSLAKKLSNEKVKLIKSLKRNGCNTKEIAEVFKLDESLICDIVYGKTYKKID